MITCEHLSGSAETNGYLIENKNCAMTLAKPLHLKPVAFRRHEGTVTNGFGDQGSDVALELPDPDPPRSSSAMTLEENERRYILAILEQTGWVIKGPDGAASILDLPSSTLRSRMKKLGIQRP